MQLGFGGDLVLSAVRAALESTFPLFFVECLLLGEFVLRDEFHELRAATHLVLFQLHLAADNKIYYD